MEEFAEKVGELIAKSGNITVYGAEKDYDSLSTAAARGAKKASGLTVGVTYGKGKDVYDKLFARMLGSAPDRHDAVRMSVWNVMYSMDVIRKHKIEFTASDLFFRGGLSGWRFGSCQKYNCSF